MPLFRERSDRPGLIGRIQDRGDDREDRRDDRGPGLLGGGRDRRDDRRDDREDRRDDRGPGLFR
jgi:hypothetical protein